ncbi:MAG: Rieske 2Fe-2S domain-containing protein [Anaerolineae bacterium]|jgi:nitrite reductase/ring-hydroxylating ferredoxin subunit|nr:Rieske 2Fe-2S domain-containing protein [Anaerolineae bacterium]
MSELSTQERFKRGAVDADRYFRFMSQFAGLTSADAETIRQTRAVIEPHLPEIIGDFYAQLLRFPATRKHFLTKDGALDQDYLELRMRHQASFWRRTMTGVFDDDYARFVDYVGRAHTSHGADPRIYIPERYVVGMIGFMQQRITEVLVRELHDRDPDLEVRGLRAWSAFLTVLTQQLSRVYGEGNEPETYQPQEEVHEEPLRELAEHSYEQAAGRMQPAATHRVLVGAADSLGDGERKIVEAHGQSIGVFRVGGQWYALGNSCLHRGGPVCQGKVEGLTVTCPWHGYQYDLPTGQLLLDRSTALPTYKVMVEGGNVYLDVPVYDDDEPDLSLEAVFPHVAAAAQSLQSETASPAAPAPALAPNEFRAGEIKPGHAKRVTVDGKAVAVYNIEGVFYATQDECTHADGPMSEGEVAGNTAICPWHASVFDVRTGAVIEGPAEEPLKVYKVVVEGEIARVME